MSHSPVDEQERSQADDPESLYRQHVLELNQLMASNGTFSGHERNCVFLNTGAMRFATASAVTHFDFDDDTRAVATVDWDGDGDLDVWTVNRTGPRVRVLRNTIRDESTANHFLAIQLTGTSCNRDAIGARVEVVTERSTPQTRHVKTLRAGEGYLTQNSKWLHFGLGPAKQIREVRIDWPDGSRETVSGLRINQRYHYRQGQRIAEPLAVRGYLTLPATETAPTPPLLDHRLPLTYRLPAPRLACTSTRGTSVAIDTKQPTLVVLWSSQCTACLEELKLLAKCEAELRQQALQVRAICVDSLLASPADPERWQTVLQDIQFPFEVGVADAELLKRLQTLADLPLGVAFEMATPTSFLFLDERLAVLYRGPLRLETVLRDLQAAQGSEPDWIAYAEPFPGRWHSPPNRQVNLMAIPRQLMERGFVVDAVDYVDRNIASLEDAPEAAKLMTWIGDTLMERKQTAAALVYYQRALAIDPGDLTVMNNVAWQFATHPQGQVRDAKAAVKWSVRAAQATKFANPGVLDTLAAAYASDGQFDKAVEVMERAIQMARRQSQGALAARLSKRLQRYQNRQPYRQSD